MNAAVWIILIYVIGTTFISVIGHRLAKDTPQDYFLANRSMGPIAMFFTLVATNFSAFFFLGFAGEGYRVGYSYYAMMSFATALVAISFYFIGDKTWRISREKDFVTPPEMIGALAKSNLLRITFLTIMVVFTLPYLAVQPIGAGKILEIISGGKIPYFVGAVSLTVFIVLYVFWGGMRSVAWTDVLQGIVMLGCVVIATLVVANHFGGIEEANRKAYELQPDLFSRSGKNDFFTTKKWLSFCLLFLFSVPMFPQMFMRFFISDSAKSLKKAAILYPIVTATLFICPVAIGVWGHLSFPDLQGRAADNILPMMLTEQYVPEWLAAAILIGAVAAFMSTLDSQLLALSSMITRDIYLAFVRPQASLKEQVVVGRTFIVVLAAIGLGIAFKPPGTIFSIVKNAFTGLGILFSYGNCYFLLEKSDSKRMRLFYYYYRVDICIVFMWLDTGELYIWFSTYFAFDSHCNHCLNYRFSVDILK